MKRTVYLRKTVKKKDKPGIEKNLKEGKEKEKNLAENEKIRTQKEEEIKRLNEDIKQKGAKVSSVIKTFHFLRPSGAY